jgi:tetratricopeptide (TPR) repeat protein
VLLVLAALGAWRWNQSRSAAARKPDISATVTQVQKLLDEALAAARQGDQEQFRKTVEDLREYPGTGEHLNLLLGVGLIFSGDHAAALKQISRVPPAGTLRRPMLQWSAECLMRLQRWGEAEQLLKLLIEEDPTDPDNHRNLATVYHNLGAMDFALAALQETGRLDPDDHRAFRLAGLILNADYANYTEAILQYRQALEKSPPEEVERAIRTELAQCLIEQRDYTAALEILEPVSEAVPVLVMRSECLWSMGELEESRKLLTQAEQERPDSVRVRLLRARMLLDEGDRQGAIAIYEELLAKEPHDFQTRYQLALAYQAAGETEAYERELARYRESEVKRGELFDMYREAMQRPADFEIRERLASLCEELGQRELAETWRKAALSARELAGQPPQEAWRQRERPRSDRSDEERAGAH